jgi:hypothetical protein
MLPSPRSGGTHLTALREPAQGHVRGIRDACLKAVASAPSDVRGARPGPPGAGNVRDREGRRVHRPDRVQARIFEGLLALPWILGDRTPVMLVLEDLHRADSSTRDMVSFSALRAPRGRGGDAPGPGGLGEPPGSNAHMPGDQPPGMQGPPGDLPQRLPRFACSRSIASKSALKFPTPKPREPCRSMISKKKVGRSWTGRVKICRR